MKIKRVSRIGKHRQENRSKNRNKLAQRKALNNDKKKRVKLYIYRRNVLFFWAISGNRQESGFYLYDTSSGVKHHGKMPL